jgi:hypothetical protein
MTPVPNKLLTIQLIIQEKMEGIFFDNDAKGCYARIISGIALALRWHCAGMFETDWLFDQLSAHAGTLMGTM